MWSTFEKWFLSVSALINSKIARYELSDFLRADITGFWRPRPYFWPASYLKFLRRGGGVGVILPKKRQCNKVSRRSYYSPSNTNPVSFITRCKNISSDWITCTIAAYISCGYLPHFFLSYQFFSDFHPSNHSLLFESFVTNKKAQITGARAYLKPLMLAEWNYSLEIIQINDIPIEISWKIGYFFKGNV